MKIEKPEIKKTEKLKIGKIKPSEPVKEPDVPKEPLIPVPLTVDFIQSFFGRKRADLRAKVSNAKNAIFSKIRTLGGFLK